MHFVIEVQMRCWLLSPEFVQVGERLKLNNATYISGRLDLVIQAAEIGTSLWGSRSNTEYHLQRECGKVACDLIDFAHQKGVLKIALFTIFIHVFSKHKQVVEFWFERKL